MSHSTCVFYFTFNLGSTGSSDSDFITGSGSGSGFVSGTSEISAGALPVILSCEI